MILLSPLKESDILNLFFHHFFPRPSLRAFGGFKGWGGKGAELPGWTWIWMLYVHYTGAELPGWTSG